MSSLNERESSFSSPSNGESIEDLVEVAMDAMRDHMWQCASEFDLKVEEFKKFFAEAMSESDRALAVLIPSYIDERMKDLFAAALNGQIRGGHASLFDNMGPLSTFSARIQMAGALCWIDRGTYMALHAMRKIRNEFAHNPFVNRFDDPRVRPFVDQLPAIEETILNHARGYSLVPLDRWTLRRRYYARAVMTAHGVIMELAIGPQAHRAGLPHGEVRTREYDRLPSEFKKLTAAAATLVVSAFSTTLQQ